MHNKGNIDNIRNSNISNSNKGNIDSNHLLYPSEASQLLKVSLQTLRRWYKDGNLSAVITPGHQMRIPKSEVNRLLGKYAPVDRVAPPEAYKGFEDGGTVSKEPVPLTTETIRLANLFQLSSDPVEAQAEQDLRFGHIPRNTNTSGSFSVK